MAGRILAPPPERSRRALGISALLFVGLLVRAARHEGRSFASLTESEPPAPDVPADGGAVPKSRTALDPVPIGE
jgi:hypothetical protein